MSVMVAEVYALLDQIAPIAGAEEWDNPGLLAGSPDKPVDTVLFALDLTEKVVEEAVRAGAQLIVTHHPILFRGRKNLLETDGEGRLLCALVRSGLSLIAMHTNYDNAHPGVNDALAGTLGLRDIEPMEHGMCAGMTDACRFSEFVDMAERALGGPIRRYGDPDRLIRRVAVLGGAGEDFWPEAKACGADAYLTGEMAYHKALDAVADGLCVMEAGHAATEAPGILALADGLQNAADAVQYNLRVLKSKTALFL